MGIQTITRAWRFVGILYALSLVVRLLFFYMHTQNNDRAWLAFDSVQYHAVATSVAHGNGFVNANGTPQFYRLPGYPLFLGFGYKLFGGDVAPLASGQEQTVGAIKKTLLTQVVVTSFIPVLVFMLSCVLFPQQATGAKLASVIAALHPGLIAYAGILSTESLFLFLFLIFLILFCLCFRRSEKVNYALAAGVVLGVASLVRPVGHYLVALSIIMLLFLRVQRCKKILFLGIGWLSVASVWLIRNYMLAGAFFFHTLPGLHFLQYAAASVVMSVDRLDYFTARDKVFAVWHAQADQKQKALGRSLTEHERYAVAERLAYEYLLSYPWVTIKNGVTQVARTCCTLYSTLFLYVPLGTVYPDNVGLWFKIKLYLMPQTIYPWLGVLVYAELLYMLWLWIGMVLFAVRAYPFVPFDTIAKGNHSGRTDRCALLLLTPFIVLFIGITFAYGCARLRFAIEPLLMLCAAHGWLWSVHDTSYDTN